MTPVFEAYLAGCPLFMMLIFVWAAVTQPNKFIVLVEVVVSVTLTIALGALWIWVVYG